MSMDDFSSLVNVQMETERMKAKSNNSIFRFYLHVYFVTYVLDVVFS